MKNLRFGCAALVATLAFVACATNENRADETASPDAAAEAAPTTEAEPTPPAEKPDPLAGRLPSGLPNAPWSLHDGMEFLSDAHAEEVLEGFVKGEGLDAEKIASLAALIRASCDRIDWTTAKKRGKNPADFDLHVADVRRLAEDLGAAALDGAFDRVPGTADKLIQRCVDCHTVYK
jgi:hypothetical protein